VDNSQSHGDSKLEARILATLRKRSTRSLHASEVRGRVGLTRAEHSEALQALERLASQGLVTKLPGERFKAQAAPRRQSAAPLGEDSSSKRRARGGELEGVLTVNVRGFGFVVTPGPEPDVFIPPGYLGSAMHGDRVRVRSKPSPKGLDGRVVAVLERAVRYIGVQLHVTAQGVTLQPDDERLRMPLRLKGKLPEQARTGMGAIANVVGYPEREGDPLEVKIVEIFEPEAFVQYEIRRILLRENVEEEFAPDVQVEASALPHAITARDRRGREDLRAIPLMTIDPADARDHDDAVWAERLPNGGYRVLVAIADVSHYVPEGSALDRVALERGCTIYLPTRAIPMLPPELSSNLASLLPKRDRLTLAVEIELDAHGVERRHRFIEGVMRSAASLTYEGVAQALGLTVHGPNQAEAYAHLAELSVLLEVAKLRRELRRARGALEFELPEAKVRVDDETGQPIDVERSRKDPGVARAYGMIEEMMLLANEVVAADLSKREVPTMYRVHGAPDPERVETFCALARALGFNLDAEVAEQPKKLARFLMSVQGTPHATALGYLLLRAMQQATYDTVNIGHFGLGADHYVHFTSPIRRYPDVAVHRVMRQVARGERIELRGLTERLKMQAGQSSLRERRSMAIEREVVDLYGAYLLRDQVGETFDATVSGVTEHGFYATLDAPFVDVLCRTAALPPDQYELDAHGVRLRGAMSGRSYALGDRVRLRIENVSIAQRKVLAVPAELPSVQPPAPQIRRSQAPKRKQTQSPGAGKKPDRGTQPGSQRAGGGGKRKRRR
jgi:ribonuclease R